MPHPSDRTASARAGNAVRAAVRAGKSLGLRPGEPRVLHNVFNVLVHLAPEPVVVRVPSLTTAPAKAQAAKQRRELALTGWLADEGAPVVGPSPLVPREPVLCEGKSLTFWEYVPEDEPLAELTASHDEETLMRRFVEQTSWVAGLHAAMARYPGELPVLGPLVPETGTALAALARQPETRSAAGLTAGDLRRAEREYETVTALVADFGRYFPAARLQPVHGDAPAFNVLRVAGRHLFNDFEDVTLGPVEWDLTMGDTQAAEKYTRAGGGPVDLALLDVMEGARMLQVLGALSLTPLMPELGPMLTPTIAQWRARAPLSLTPTPG